MSISECPDGTYGDLCDQECHCHNIDEVCDKGTGYCDKSRSCAPGWTGIVCQCRKSFYYINIDLDKHNYLELDCKYFLTHQFQDFS